MFGCYSFRKLIRASRNYGLISQICAFGKRGLLIDWRSRKSKNNMV
jgi:hypothetical protein